MAIKSVGIPVLGVLILATTAATAAAQTTDAGRTVFESRCARCHGGDGNGGEMGPPIRERLTTRDAEQLTKLIHEGIPLKGMPPSDLGEPETTALVAFLRSIERRPETAPVVRLQVQTTDGSRWTGSCWPRDSTICSCAPTTGGSTCCAAPASASAR